MSAQIEKKEPGPVPPPAPVEIAKTDLPGQLEMVARIVKVSRVPQPGTAPYKDCLTYIKLEIERLVSGEYTAKEIVVGFKAMIDNVWLPAASYGPGDRIRLRLIPMNLAPREIQNMQRADDLDDFTLQPYYCIAGEKG
jgi:hypothetical protein